MRIATLAGIPLRLHWSFVGLAGLFALFILWTTGPFESFQLLFLGTVLFGSVVLHELGHALAARVYGIDTAHITLYPFGGIAAITRMPTSPRQELVIALAGPAVNFVIFAAALLLWLPIGGWVLVAVGGLNLLMGVFNLLPAFPMDGGRVLRALLADRWGWVPASRFAMGVGQIFAIGLLGLGVVTLQDEFPGSGDTFEHYAYTALFALGQADALTM